MADVFHRSLFLRGPAGRLEALLWTVGDRAPQFAAVACHPHPLYAGTMHNKVVYQAAKTLHRFDIPVLRFNFRGAGLSEGAHDRGRGEKDDVRAAVVYMAQEYPNSLLLLVGFSFGSWVGLRVGCEDSRVAGLIGLGVPVDGSDFSYLHSCTKPKLFVQSAQDPFGSRAVLEALFSAIPEPKKLVFIEARDHFFAGGLDKMSDAIRDGLVDFFFPRLNLSPRSE
jgi:uncharacterized protein